MPKKIGNQVRVLVNECKLHSGQHKNSISYLITNVFYCGYVDLSGKRIKILLLIVQSILQVVQIWGGCGSIMQLRCAG